MEDAAIPCCSLADEDYPPKRRFPKAELCVAGSALCGFLVASGLTMVVLHYTVESREGFRSLAGHHLGIATHVLGLSFVALAGALFLGTLFAYAVWKAVRVVEMAHRYRQHRELCGAYEDTLRHSIRSQQSGSRACAADSAGRFSTPRK